MFLHARPRGRYCCYTSCTSTGNKGNQCCACTKSATNANADIEEGDHEEGDHEEGDHDEGEGDHQEGGGDSAYGGMLALTALSLTVLCKWRVMMCTGL